MERKTRIARFNAIRSTHVFKQRVISRPRIKGSFVEKSVVGWRINHLMVIRCNHIQYDKVKFVPHDSANVRGAILSLYQECRSRQNKQAPVPGPFPSSVPVSMQANAVSQCTGQSYESMLRDPRLERGDVQQSLPLLHHGKSLFSRPSQQALHQVGCPRLEIVYQNRCRILRLSPFG
jgi:hypothetical protein